MNHFFSLIAHHGYLFIFGVVFSESIGLPVPSALALVAGGAAAAGGSLQIPVLIPLAVGAMLLGDTLLFVLGRYMGWGLLAILCRLSINPESCILRSAESFYKRGKLTLLVAKFIPGVNTMAPPLAGSMKMRPWQFLRLDFVGVSFYVLAYGTLGYLFRDFLAAITRGLQAAGRVFSEVLLFGAIVYIGYRIWVYQKNKVYKLVPRIQVQELARRLSQDSGDVIVVDVRSHGYYDPKAERIKGSIRLEPNNLLEELKNLPREKDVYVYCT